MKKESEIIDRISHFEGRRSALISKIEELASKESLSDSDKRIIKGYARIIEGMENQLYGLRWVIGDVLDAGLRKSIEGEEDKPTMEWKREARKIRQGLQELFEGTVEMPEKIRQELDTDETDELINETRGLTKKLKSEGENENSK